MARRLGVLFFLLLLLVGCNRSDDPARSRLGQLKPFTVPERPRAENLVGKPIPSFRMTDIQEQSITDESLRGKVVLIDFWATWCVPCKLISPILQDLHAKYAAKGLVVIGADTSEQDSFGLSSRIKDWAADYAREHKYTYTFTYGNDDFKRLCHVDGLPTLFLIDKKGIVRKVQPGYYPEMRSDLEDALKPLLDEES
jgi:cytochrome c biogenesis protein CcmG, thiol:disulfide interchange protein DsbE